MTTDAELDAFLDADAGPSDDELDAFLDAEPPKKPFEGAKALAFSNAETQAVNPFSEEIQAGAETVGYAASEAVQGRFDVRDLVDYYRDRRDTYRKETEQLAEAEPEATTAGTATGIAATVATSGVNPVSVGRSLVRGGAALATREGLKGAGRALLSVEGAKAVGSGAAIGGAYALGSSEADLTEGEFGQAAADVAEGAKTGAVVGGSARALAGSGSAAVEASAQRAQRAVAEATAAERDRALLVTGLDGKQSTLGGPVRAKARAQALFDEPLPGDPSKRLVEEAKSLTPDERVELATGLRRDAGAALGAVRDDLAKVDVTVPAASLRTEIRGAFSNLPTEVQGNALEQVDRMIGALSKDGGLTPAALRKLIEDSEGLARYGTPNLEAALGKARGRVFQAARAVLVQNERELVEKLLPDQAGAYADALRKYAVYSDFELGSQQMLRRANRGQTPVREPVRERDLSVRQLLVRTGAGEIGARAGAMLPIPGSAYAGARAAQGVVDRWARWTQPNIAALSAKVQKLERLRPMMDRALSEGPQAVAALHARFMRRSPDYRKAFESGE